MTDWIHEPTNKLRWKRYSYKNVETNIAGIWVGDYLFVLEQMFEIHPIGDIGYSDWIPVPMILDD